MIIQLQQISKSFGPKTLFENVHFKLEAYDRLALVGSNGAGKTTLLNIISGREEPDSGEVVLARGAKIGYLEQEAIEMADRAIFDEVLSSQTEVIEAGRVLRELEDSLTTDASPEKLEAVGKARYHFEHVGGYTIERNVRTILFGLGFKEDDLKKSTNDFSGGWQMRIALAKLLVRNPDVLLLDEPTNHLDLESVKWLENFLRGYEGSVIVVSHDRAFMDHMVDRVAEIAQGGVTLYKGNYSAYLKQREERYELLVEKARRQQEEIAHMQAFIDRFRSKPTKARQVQERIRKIEQMEIIEVPERAKRVHFNFVQPPRTGDMVVELSHINKSYGQHEVYKDFSLSIYRGEKIALVGPNGAGKSTLLKMIAGVLPFEAGSMKLGAHVTRSYFAQHQLEELYPGNTVFEELDKVAPGWNISQVRTLLGAFLFKGDDVQKPVRVLSGGEKCRLALAKMLVAPAPLLCLDEPTNHLDISSADVLEQALKRFEGTIVFITHDRHLIESVATKIIHIDAGVATEYDGDWHYYLEKTAQANEVSATVSSLNRTQNTNTKLTDARPKTASVPSDVADDPARASQSTRTYKTKEQKRAEAEARNKAYAALKSERKRFKELEVALEKDQSRMEEILQTLADPEFYTKEDATSDIISEHAALKKRLEEEESEWLMLAEKIEEETKRYQA